MLWSESFSVGALSPSAQIGGMPGAGSPSWKKVPMSFIEGIKPRGPASHHHSFQTRRRIHGQRARPGAGASARSWRIVSPELPPCATKLALILTALSGSARQHAASPVHDQGDRGNPPSGQHPHSHGANGMVRGADHPAQPPPLAAGASSSQLSSRLSQWLQAAASGASPSCSRPRVVVVDHCDTVTLAGAGDCFSVRCASAAELRIAYVDGRAFAERSATPRAS